MSNSLLGIIIAIVVAGVFAVLAVTYYVTNKKKRDQQQQAAAATAFPGSADDGDDRVALSPATLPRISEFGMLDAAMDPAAVPEQRSGSLNSADNLTVQIDSLEDMTAGVPVSTTRTSPDPLTLT